MIAILVASLLSTASASAVPALVASGELPHGEAEGVSGGSCPTGWVDASFVDMGCLYFNSTKGMTWDDAVSSCHIATTNSSLVEITTEAQMDFVQMMLEMIEEHESARHWWTAATDVGINGKWFWAASLATVEDFVWHSGYPNSLIDRNCMMLHSSYKEGTNQNCDYTGAYPLCQLK